MEKNKRSSEIEGQLDPRTFRGNNANESERERGEVRGETRSYLDISLLVEQTLGCCGEAE